MSSSPLVSRKAKAPVSTLPPRFATVKPILSTKTARDLVSRTCSTAEKLWIERWLDSLVQSRCLPPQCRGKDAFNALKQILGSDSLRVLLEQLQWEFLAAHPEQRAPPLEGEGGTFQLNVGE